MADAYTQVAPDSTGDKIDTSELTVGAHTVNRQRVVLADDSTAAGFAKVQNSEPGSSDYGVTARIAGTANVAQLPEVVSANFTRPANTTAYASADLVANNTTAGSVTPLSWTVGRSSPGRCWITAARLKKSNTSTTNASFRLHLFTSSPTVTNGDNGVFTLNEQNHIGTIDLTALFAFSDSALAYGAANYGPIAVDLSGSQTLYGLLEARAAYTPGSSEVFTVNLTVVQ